MSADRDRISYLESLLRSRDVADSEAKKAQIAKDLEAAARSKEVAESVALREKTESLRRGSWLSHAIASAPPEAPVSLLEIEIPESGWAPGWDIKTVEGAGALVPDIKPDISTTLIGRLLAKKQGASHAD